MADCISIEDAIDGLNKKCGRTIISKASDAHALKIIRMPSGSLKADALLGGGFAYKRAIEIYGEEHVGKSFFLNKFISENQKVCGYCKKYLQYCKCDKINLNKILYEDFETTFGKEDKSNEGWAELCGVDFNKLAITVPKSWEEGIDLVVLSITQNYFDIIVIDSVTAAPVCEEIDKDADEDTMMKKAKKNSLFTRLVSSALAPNDITDVREAYKPVIIMLQQVNADVGKRGFNGMKPKPTIYGGHAIKHYKHMSLEITTMGYINELGETWTSSKQEKCGRILKIKVEKDKVGGKYWQTTNFNYYFRDVSIPVDHKKKFLIEQFDRLDIDILNAKMEFHAGEIDWLSEYIDVAIEKEIIKQSGAFYEVPGIEGKVQGMANLKPLLYFDKELFANIKKQVDDIIYAYMV